VPEPSIDDYRWLVSDAAERYLADAATGTSSLVAQTQQLRKDLSPERAHLILEQVELRQRAGRKFSQTSQMYFTRQLLEQATDERIAAYKASRFPAQRSSADLCCGIGGDLLALAARGRCLAVDRDPVAILLAEANCRQFGRPDVRFETADVAEIFERLDTTAWHLDPDRRRAGTRTSRVEFSDPGLDVINSLANGTKGGAIKLAPAGQFPLDLAADVELEWIGSRRECRQQVAWVGELAGEAGRRTATVVDDAGSSRSFSGQPEDACRRSQPARLVYDLDSTVVAARLGEALANKFDLAGIGPMPSYLTSDKLITSPLFDVFTVDEVLPMDLKRLKGVIRDRKIGSLEIKVRNARLTPEELRPKLRLRGDEAATLLIYRGKREVRAILARRLPSDRGTRYDSV
jgi:hypothetical protein